MIARPILGRRRLLAPLGVALRMLVGTAADWNEVFDDTGLSNPYNVIGADLDGDGVPPGRAAKPPSLVPAALYTCTLSNSTLSRSLSPPNCPPPLPPIPGRRHGRTGL